MRQLSALLLLLTLAGCSTQLYRDGRSEAEHRLDVLDQGIVLRYGGGPDSCDVWGARDVWVFEDNGKYIMHYDGTGPSGWLAVRATSTDLLSWTVDGPVLSLGGPGTPDQRSASYGLTYRDDSTWHMFYLGTNFVSPYPDQVPSLPYVTLKARSTSAFGPWKKQYNVTPFSPVPGTYHASTASPGQIVRIDGEYRMFFSGAVDTLHKIHRTLGIARTRSLDSAWRIDPKPILPSGEQIENAALYFQEATQTWFLFTNHVGLTGPEEYTDASWVYWTQDINSWSTTNKAIVLDGKNCSWAHGAIGLPSVLRVGGRLALFYDGVEGSGTEHVRRHIGLAWIDLPIRVPLEVR